MVTVAVDAMGGDHAPAEIVHGAIAAARDFGVEVILVGRPEAIQPHLRAANAHLPIVPATEVVAMDDHPARAVRALRDSSLVVGVNLLQTGRAEAFLSAGNSGAVMAAALLQLQRIEGIRRPAIGSVWPTAAGGRVIVVDSGANVSCKATYFVDFAHLGAAYLERVFGTKQPRIGLVSNGEEPSKGSSLVIEAHRLLAEADLNFVGNIEGKDVFSDKADVLVTDGFTGNVMLKLAEGLAEHIVTQIRAELTARWIYRLGAALSRPAFRALARRIDSSTYGGAPLLGVNGAVMIAHGRAERRAIKNAVRAVADMAREDVVGAIQAHVAGRSHHRGLRLRLTRGLLHGTAKPHHEPDVQPREDDEGRPV